MAGRMDVLAACGKVKKTKQQCPFCTRWFKYEKCHRRFCDKNPALLYTNAEDDTMADYLKMCRPTSPTSPTSPTTYPTTYPTTPCPTPCSVGQYTSHPSTYYLIELVPQPVMFRDILDELVKITDNKLQMQQQEQTPQTHPYWPEENQHYPPCDTTSTPDYQSPPQSAPQQSCDHSDSKRQKLSPSQDTCYEQISAGWMDCTYETLQTHGYATGHDQPLWDSNSTLHASYLEDLLQNDLVSAF